jgi:hypothetical protein
MHAAATNSNEWSALERPLELMDMNTKSSRLLLLLVALAALLLLSAVACTSIVNEDLTDDFKSRLGDLSMTVYPAFVRGRTAGDSGYDSLVADRLAAFLVTSGRAVAEASSDEVPLAGEWQSNQAAMWKASALSFAEFVAAHPVETDFALVAEYLIGGEQAGGVQCYVVNTTGDVVWGCHLNSHFDVFADADPKSPAACTEVLIAFLRDDWPSR